MPNKGFKDIVVKDETLQTLKDIIAKGFQVPRYPKLQQAKINHTSAPRLPS